MTLVRPEGATRPDDAGVLRVQVRSRETGAVLAGVPVHVSRPDAGRGSEAGLQLDGASDEGGWVAFPVPLGVSLRARVPSWHRDPHDPRDGRPHGTGAGDVQVPALTSREPVGVVLEVATEPQRFVGRAVSADTGEPLSDARVAFVERLSAWVLRDGDFQREGGALAHVQVDEQGYFEHRRAPWQDGLYELTAPGHGLTTLEPAAGCESRATALEARLERSGTVEVTVRGPAGEPLELAELALSTAGYRLTSTPKPTSRSYGTATWTARTGRDGTRALEDLPSGVPLELRCAPLRGPMFDHPPLVLATGEHRTVVFDLGGGSLEGRVEAGSGPAAGVAAGVEVWLLPRVPTFEGSLHPQDASAARSARTGPGGEFAFTGVVDGTWWVGIAPGGELAPLAQAVVVAGDTGREVLLEARTGLEVAGVVIDPEGAPVAGVQVWATGTMVRAGEESDASGGFRLRGFPAGPVQVGATTWGAGGLAHPEPVVVEAGDQDVVLRLRAGAEIRGMLVDARTAEPLAGEVWCGRVDGALRMRPASESGQFVFPGLEPGVYDLLGITPDGRVGRAGTSALAAGASAAVELRARQGAALTLRHQGPEPRLSYRLSAGGLPLHSGALAAGSEERRVVPAGPVRVECAGGASGEAWARELTLVAGDERAIVLRQDE